MLTSACGQAEGCFVVCGRPQACTFQSCPHVAIIELQHVNTAQYLHAALSWRYSFSVLIVKSLLYNVGGGACWWNALISAGKLFISCARLLDGWLTRPLSVSQHGQLSIPPSGVGVMEENCRRRYDKTVAYRPRQ